MSLRTRCSNIRMDSQELQKSSSATFLHSDNQSLR
ncbi:hypothetical protein X975_05718, partial [Stegodyphus mimosarum]